MVQIILIGNELVSCHLFKNPNISICDSSGLIYEMLDLNGFPCILSVRVYPITVGVSASISLNF